MRIKFLKSIGDAHGVFNTGDIVEMDDAVARQKLKTVYNDGSRLCVEVNAKECPNCGHKFEEEPQGPLGALEAATVSHNPRRRG